MEKRIQKLNFVYAANMEDPFVAFDLTGEILSVFDLSDPSGLLSVHSNLL